MQASSVDGMIRLLKLISINILFINCVDFIPMFRIGSNLLTWPTVKILRRAPMILYFDYLSRDNTDNPARMTNYVFIFQISDTPMTKTSRLLDHRYGPIMICAMLF